MSDKRQRAKKTAKFLALIPVVGLAAACNGVAPTGPSEFASNDASAALTGEASSMGRGSSRLCAGLKGINLQVVDSDDKTLWVVATYQFSGPAPTACAAPAWTSDRDGMRLDKANPFRAGFARDAGGRAILTATAPSGVHGSITLDLTSNRLGGERGCLDITGVDLQIVPITSDPGQVSLVATYRSSGPGAEGCAIGPSWSASRRGLRVDEKNPFKAYISAAADGVRTTVTATAPNGAAGKISF